MKGINEKLASTSSINGIIQITASLYWIWHFGNLLYLYHYTDDLFIYMYPNWVLILFILMAVVGSLIGISVFLKKQKIKNGYFQLIGLFVIGLIIDLFVVL